MNDEWTWSRYNTFYKNYCTSIKTYAVLENGEDDQLEFSNNRESEKADKERGK